METENKLKNKKITYSKSKTMVRKLSPKSFLYKHVFCSVPTLKQKKKKISQEDFEMLQCNEYDKILKINYNVKQLKMICGNYKLKKSGDKKELIFRVYNYLKYSFYSIKIQKIWRGYFRRYFNNLKGPSFKSKKCVNEIDFLTLQPLKKIHHSQFVSYKDKDNFIYGFDIKSLYNLWNHANKQNPYNRNLFPKNLKLKVNKIIKLSKIFNESINIVINDERKKVSIEQKIKLKTIDIFQEIDNHGFITNTSWFLDLTRVQLLRYIKELIDIWEYRANLSMSVKRNIYPPNGHPFVDMNGLNIDLNNDNRLKLDILKIIERLVTKGLTNSDRSLGAYYVLGAFTIVSENARNALPWMYETFGLF